jgi:hypothetical protein
LQKYNCKCIILQILAKIDRINLIDSKDWEEKIGKDILKGAARRG